MSRQRSTRTGVRTSPNTRENRRVWAVPSEASLLEPAPMYLETTAAPPTPSPVPRPVMTSYRGAQMAVAARASVPRPEHQALSARALTCMTRSAIRRGTVIVLMAFLGSPSSMDTFPSADMPAVSTSSEL